MRILLSNDDGYQAPGLAALHSAISGIAETVVVAPDRDRSGQQLLTLEQPIRARAGENGFIRVEGTPTDCVHLAITGLLEEEPDMVVSGINAGANMGDDVIYSGTVAAATEGGFSVIRRSRYRSLAYAALLRLSGAGRRRPGAASVRKTTGGGLDTQRQCTGPSL